MIALPFQACRRFWLVRRHFRHSMLKYHVSAFGLIFESGNVSWSGGCVRLLERPTHKALKGTRVSYPWFVGAHGCSIVITSSWNSSGGSYEGQAGRIHGHSENAYE